MSSNFLSGTTTQIYPYELGSALRRERIFDPDYALQQDLDFYWKIRRDPVIAHALEQRRHLVAGRDWFIEPAESTRKARQAAKIVEQLISHISCFASVRFNLAEAVITGSKWGRLYGEVRRVKVEGAQPAEWYVLSGGRDQAKQRFAFFRKADAPVNAPAWEWRLYVPEGTKPGWQPIDRRNYVRHVYDEAEETLSYGRGLSEALYLYFWAKTNVLEHGLQFLDRWAQGMVIAEVDALSDSATADNSPTKANAYLTALEKQRARHIFVHDSRDKITVLDAPTGGWQSATQALAYLDDAMRTLILGANLPTSATEGGSYALGKVQENSTEALIQYDRTLLEETIDRDLVGLLWRANRPNLVKMGLWEFGPGRFRIRQEKHEDPVQRAQVIQMAINAGIPLRRDEVYSSLGFSPPLDDDDVIEGRPATLAAPSGAPDGPSLSSTRGAP